MRIAVLGTGTVGRTLAGKLVETGHSVTIGSRSATNEAALEWAAGAGPHAKAATFFDAAADGEVIINATPGTVSLEVLAAASTKNLDGKVLIDVANPLDQTAGFPPSLSISNTDSLAETIQRSFPTARVVKALNTMRADVMVAPDRLAGGDHDVFHGRRRRPGQGSGCRAPAGIRLAAGAHQGSGSPRSCAGNGDVASAVAPHLPSARRTAYSTSRWCPNKPRTIAGTENSLPIRHAWRRGRAVLPELRLDAQEGAVVLPAPGLLVRIRDGQGGDEPLGVVVLRERPSPGCRSPAPPACPCRARPPSATGCPPRRGRG